MAESGLGTAPKKISEPIHPAGAITSTTAPSECAQTGFDGKTFTPQSDSTLAVNSTTRKVRTASRRFYVAAAISLMETAFFVSSDFTLATLCAIVAVTFAILGALRDRLNRTSVLIGMTIYVVQTVQLLVHGWTTAMIIVAYTVFVHCAILYRLYLSYGIISHLETAEI